MPDATAATSTGSDAAGAQRTLRCGVVGTGRMGRHHVRKYASLSGSELVGVVDENAERRAAMVEEFGCPAFETEEQLIEAGVDAVSIAVPTTFHLKCARPLLNAGVACLIEKPLANTVEEASELAALARSTGATLMVGHIER
ncbi:MAG: Gfo/Idh/MocA family oxidoreductase, partial [Phycisphaerales bacterium]|nr:Gfo/Idh/MocA family oxidoreductase [Phycisphaerales bacterium]